MIKILDSVGRHGVNKAKDVRSVQTALLRLGYLSPTHYNRECLNLTIEKPIDQIKTEILSGKIDEASWLFHMLKGDYVLPELHLLATIQAIFDFQEEDTDTPKPNGRIEPHSTDEKRLNNLLKYGKL